MKNIDTLIIPRWIVPIEPANTVLENHAIAIVAGRIQAILPITQALALSAKETIHLNNHVIMPGLVNAHTHNPMTLFRGLADDLPLMTWLNDHIWPAERKWLSHEFCYDGTRLAILEMLLSGTTCFNDNYFFSEAIAQAAVDMQMRAAIGACIIEFPTAYANSPDDYLVKAENLYLASKNNPLLKFTIAPHAPYTVSDATFNKVKSFADKHDVFVQLHLHETSDEIKLSLEQYGMRPVQRIQQLGLLNERLQCIHMTQIDDSDIKLLQNSGAHIVHCPKSNLKLASGFAPIQRLQSAGLNIALGTDGAASNNTLDMFAEMQTAALLAKGVASDPTALNAMKALQMATLDGAKALGWEKEIGSIEPGKAADLIAVELSSYNTQPIYHLISHLVYALNVRQVSHVWIAGQPRVMNGKPVVADEATILANAANWAKKITA